MMIEALKPIYPGATKRFSILCKINDVVQDVTSDTLTFRMKSNESDTDLQAILTKVAEVASQGASGIGIFNLTPGDTSVLTEGTTYFYDIVWLDGTNEYIANDGTVLAKKRVSDI